MGPGGGIFYETHSSYHFNAIYTISFIQIGIKKLHRKHIISIIVITITRMDVTTSEQFRQMITTIKHPKYKNNTCLLRKWYGG